MVVIEESGMQFGEYREDQVFMLEHTPVYQTLSAHSTGIKSCEFILLRNSILFFVEAKASAPTGKLGEYLTEISLKMRHSLALYAGMLLGRHSSADIPPLLMKGTLSEVGIRLLLVIKNVKPEALPHLQDSFRAVLKPDLRLWRIDDFFVINEEIARKKHFII